MENINKKKLENKQKLWDKQIQLQEQMQKDGYNIVSCGNCGTLIIHEIDDETFSTPNLDCHGCGITISKSDCSDYYYKGMSFK